MQKKEKKTFVFMAFQPNEKGFTFIATLVMLTILSLSLPFLSYTLKLTVPNTSYDELSVQEFYKFIRDELIKSTSYSISEDELHLVQRENRNEKVAIISLKGKNIRRQVDGQGHEVFLRDIKYIEFKETQFGIEIIMEDLNGEVYKKSFVFYNK